MITPWTIYRSVGNVKTSEQMLDEAVDSLGRTALRVKDQRDNLATALKAMIRQAEQSSDFDQREIYKARAALREAQV